MEEKANVLIKLSREKHTDLKVVAAKKGVSIQKLVESLIDEYIKKNIDNVKEV